MSDTKSELLYESFGSIQTVIFNDLSSLYCDVRDKGIINKLNR